MGNITNQYIGNTVLQEVRKTGYTLVLQTKSKRTTQEIQDEHLKYIAEITKDLGPIQSEELNTEQKNWLYFRLQRSFPKPCRPWAPIVLPLKWQEEE